MKKRKLTLDRKHDDDLIFDAAEIGKIGQSPFRATALSGVWMVDPDDEDVEYERVLVENTTLNASEIAPAIIQLSRWTTLTGEWAVMVNDDGTVTFELINDENTSE